MPRSEGDGDFVLCLHWACRLLSPSHVHAAIMPGSLQIMDVEFALTPTGSRTLLNRFIHARPASNRDDDCFESYARTHSQYIKRPPDNGAMGLTRVEVFEPADNDSDSEHPDPETSVANANPERVLLSQMGTRTVSTSW